MVRCAKTSYVITYGYDALGRQTWRSMGSDPMLRASNVVERGRYNEMCIIERGSCR